MMEEYLLDSNILIYLSNGNEKVTRALLHLKREYFFISTISIVEVLMGEKNTKDIERLRKWLEQFVPIDMNREIAEKSALLAHESNKKLKFKDLLIATTARTEALTLLTADKDFKGIKAIKVKLLEL